MSPSQAPTAVAEVQSDGRTLKIRSAGTATITANQAGGQCLQRGASNYPNPHGWLFNFLADSFPGIRLWLDANNIDGYDTADSISDSTAIVQWIDQSGNNNHPGQITASNRPIYGKEQLGSRALGLPPD